MNLGRKHCFLGDFNDSLILSPSVPAKAKCKVSPTTRLIALLLSFDEALEREIQCSEYYYWPLFFLDDFLRILGS